jgi:hypothetical protein
LNVINSIDNTVALLNKYNTTIKNKTSVQNKYINKVKENLKMIDKTKNISKQMVKNSNNTTINVVSDLSQLQNDANNKMKVIPNKAVSIMKATKKRIKKLWKGSIGKGFKLGIKKDKKTSKMIEKVKNKWLSTWATLAKKLAPLLRPVLQKITKLMESKAMRQMIKFIYVFLGALINGVAILLDCIAPIIDVIGNIFSFMFDNAEYVLIILGAIATAITAIGVVLAIYNAISKAYNLITTISTAVTEALGKAQLGLPIVFIISVIIILITIFITLIATMEPVRKVIVNITKCLFNLVEFGINALIEALACALEGIIKFAGDGINMFLNIFVNPFIGGINLVIDALNLLGANIDKVQYMKVDFSGAAKATGKFIRDKKVNLDGVRDKVAGAIDNISAEELKKKLGIDKLQKEANKKDVPVQVNKIKDNVNIADEDIKLMREVAEREMIQNFVTLTPTVSMGDMTVNENADADKLLGKITEALVKEVANSAQGVYA